MDVVILAAGVGSRLGQPFPKPLTELADGRSIMARQVESLRSAFPASRLYVVVGFKKDMIMEAFPEVGFIYNPFFGETNTSKSLLRALQFTGVDGTLWLNGDVVYDPELLTALRPHLQRDESFVAVDTAAVGEEEVKYSLDGSGFIHELSKQVDPAAGEAVGINYIASSDKGALVDHLTACDDQDYFERGMEQAIAAGQMRVRAVDVSEWLCIEIDFREDLARANDAIR